MDLEVEAVGEEEEEEGKFRNETIHATSWKTFSKLNNVLVFFNL